MNKLDNNISGNQRTSGDPIWIIAARNNLKPKIVKTTDLNGVTKIRIGKDETVKRVFKTKAQREHEANLRKEIQHRKNITFLN